jgi:hypothetical protein
MAHLKTIVEASWDDGDGESKARYYLLHWGLKYDLISEEKGSVPIHYTIGICQHCKTGVIETFLPEQLRVIGDNIKID